MSAGKVLAMVLTCCCVAAVGVRTRGRVQPRVCLRNRKVCSRSKRRKNICHNRSMLSVVIAVAEKRKSNVLYDGALNLMSDVCGGVLKPVRDMQRVDFPPKQRAARASSR